MLNAKEPHFFVPFSPNLSSERLVIPSYGILLVFLFGSLAKPILQSSLAYAY